MSIEAMKQALEAVESWQKDCLDFGRGSDELGMATKAVTALRQAIEEEEKREWVGLTDDEYEELLETKDWGGSLIAATEAKSKEKNT